MEEISREEVLEIARGARVTYIGKSELDNMIPKIEGSEMFGDREFALDLVKANGDLFWMLSEELRNDEKFFWIAHNSCGCDDWDLYEATGTNLKNNKQFILRLIEITGNPFWILDIEGLASDKEAVYKALEVSDARQMLDWIEEIDEKFAYDREFIIRAVAKDKEALEWACEEIQQDDTILTEAMIYVAGEKERLEERIRRVKELYASYEKQVDNNGKTQADN